MRATHILPTSLLVPGLLAGMATPAAGATPDTLPGFDANTTAGQDRLDLRPLGITAATFASSVTITGPAGGPTTVTVTGEGTITLPGVQPAAVTRADFVLL